MAIQAETAIPEVVVAAIDSVGTITSGTINYVAKLGSVGSTIPVSFVDTTSTVQAQQATSPWTVETTTSTVQVEQVTSPWIVQTTTSTIPQVTSIGSTVDTAITSAAVMIPTDAQAVYQSAVTLWESTNAEATTNTSAAVDISTFVTKTVCIYCTQASTLVIQTTPTSSTATWYDYYTDNNVPANTYTTKSFTDAQYWCRLQVIPSAASTLSAWIVRQVG